MLHKVAGALALKFSADGSGEIEGYGSVFDVIDSYGDVIKPGAFAKSLAEAQKSGRLPAMLWQHRMEDPIGVWTEMREDARGLYVKGRLLIEDDELARRAFAHLKAGSVTGLSIGYRRTIYESNGRDIVDLELKEVSLVTMPANEDARITAVKAFAEAKSIREIEALLRDVQRPSQAEAKAIISAVKGAVRRDVEAEIAAEQEQAAIVRLLDSLKGN
jgi:HK97 family phage prohead protease